MLISVLWEKKYGLLADGLIQSSDVHLLSEFAWEGTNGGPLSISTTRRRKLRKMIQEKHLRGLFGKNLSVAFFGFRWYLIGREKMHGINRFDFGLKKFLCRWMCTSWNSQHNNPSLSRSLVNLMGDFLVSSAWWFDGYGVKQDSVKLHCVRDFFSTYQIPCFDTPFLSFKRSDTMKVVCFIVCVPLLLPLQKYRFTIPWKICFRKAGRFIVSNRKKVQKFLGGDL